MIDPRYDKAVVCLIGGVVGLLLSLVIIFGGLARSEMRRWRGKL